jgi:hypothetical protein
VETDAVTVDDDGNPQTVEPEQKPGDDVILKKAIEVVTKGKSDIASARPVR